MFVSASLSPLHPYRRCYRYPYLSLLSLSPLFSNSHQPSVPSQEINFLIMCCDENHDGQDRLPRVYRALPQPGKEIGFNLAVLLTNLSEHMPNDPRSAGGERGVGGGRGRVGSGRDRTGRDGVGRDGTGRGRDEGDRTGRGGSGRDGSGTGRDGTGDERKGQG